MFVQRRDSDAEDEERWEDDDFGAVTSRKRYVILKEEQQVFIGINWPDYNLSLISVYSPLTCYTHTQIAQNSIKMNSLTLV